MSKELLKLSLYETNPQEAELQAKELYFRGFKQREISERLGIPSTILKHFIYGRDATPGWRDSRREVEMKALRQVHTQAKLRYAEMLNQALSVVERSLKSLNEPLRNAQGELMVDAITGEKLYPVVGVSQMEKLTKMAGTLQALHNDAEERGAAQAGVLKGKTRVTLTVEKVLARLQEVDPIGYGADDWGDTEKDAIEVDFDVVQQPE